MTVKFSSLTTSAGRRLRLQCSGLVSKYSREEKVSVAMKGQVVAIGILVGIFAGVRGQTAINTVIITAKGQMLIKEREIKLSNYCDLISV